MKPMISKPHGPARVSTSSKPHPAMKSIRHHTRRLPALAWFAFLPLMSLLPLPASANQWVTLRIEKAPTLSGPWTPLDLNAIPRDPNGNPRLPADQPNEFYRTLIDLGPSVGIGDSIPLSEVPVEFRDRADSFLKNYIGETEEQVDPEGWPEGARIGPRVYPHLVASADGSVKPGFFEFKVLLPALPSAPPPGGPVLTDPEEAGLADAGYLLLSTTDDDFPVAEFATEGPTPHERLARLAKTGRIQVVRYGPTFFAAEDEKGELLATDGATPFKLDPNVFALDGLQWRGDSDTGLDEFPRAVPELKTDHYRNYLEFKADFAANPLYQQIREIRKARAKLQWDVERGRSPDGVNVALRQTVRLLDTLPATPLPEFSFVSDDEGILGITADPRGGLLLTGEKPGDGTLHVRHRGQEFVFLVNVAAGIRPRAFGDVTHNYWYAADWGAQPKYHQLTHSNWCNLVGCGPTAWAMLFAWFERNRGVEHAFNGNGKAPPDLGNASNRSKVIPVYHTLHDLCDVICNPFGNDGATWPTDMTDGFKGYTFFPALTQLIGRQWNINAITGTWPDAGALRSAEAVKKGYPAVTGLGYFWHYVLAYGYHRKTVELFGGQKVHYRYVKCNMGWKNSSPKWYNISDTFYAADCRLWKGALAP